MKILEGVLIAFNIAGGLVTLFLLGFIIIMYRGEKKYEKNKRLLLR